MQVAPAKEFVEAVLATVADAKLKSLPTNIGNVDMLYGTNNGSTPAAEHVYRALLAKERPHTSDFHLTE